MLEQVVQEEPSDQTYITHSLPVATTIEQFIQNLEALLFEFPLRSWMGVALQYNGNLSHVTRSGMWNGLIGAVKAKGIPTHHSVGCAVQRALGNGPECLVFTEAGGTDKQYRASVQSLAAHPLLAQHLAGDEVAAIVSASDSMNVAKYMDIVKRLAMKHAVALRYLPN